MWDYVKQELDASPVRHFYLKITVRLLSLCGLVGKILLSAVFYFPNAPLRIFVGSIL